MKFCVRNIIIHDRFHEALRLHTIHLHDVLCAKILLDVLHFEGISK